MITIEQVMTKKVITVTPEYTLEDALRVAKENKIRHLPVAEEGRLVGLISDRDLRAVCPSTLCPEDPELLRNTLIKDIMHNEVITIHPLDFLEEAARLLYEYKIGCLPVVRNNDLVGIVTETDVLRNLVEILGLLKPGSHIEVEVPNRPGTLAEIARIVKDHGVNIISVVLTPGRTKELQVLVMRLQAFDLRKIIKEIEEAGFAVLWPRHKS